MIKILFILLILSVTAISAGAKTLDSLNTVFANAAKKYDTATLEALGTRLDGALLQQPADTSLLLLRAFVAWRLELIAFCNDDAEKIGKYGEMALELFDRAEKSGASAYICSSHRALANQLLATLGMGGGMKYGPKSATELKKAKQLQPYGYYTLLTEALNYNQAPPIAGGNPLKAVVSLDSLARRFPDSAEVKIHLADACRKTGSPERGRMLIAQVLAANPQDLLAKRVSDSLNGK